MLQNATSLAIVAIHTAANEPPKVRQVMNKVHRNVGLAPCEAVAGALPAVVS